MKHVFAANGAPTQVPGALAIVMHPADRVAVWLAATDASVCDDTAGEACHNHSALADCTCPAACASLFSLAASSPRLATEAAAALPDGTRRLLAMSSAPPTPPPRA